MALFVLEYQPADENLFRGMLAESARAAMVCGEKVIPLELCGRPSVEQAGRANANADSTGC